VTAGALLALAAFALLEARRAAVRDRAVNPPDRTRDTSPSVRVLSALGRRPAALIAARGFDVTAFEAGAVTASAGLAVVAFAAIGGVAGVIAALALAGFGAAYPRLWLRAAASRRAERIERRVPELVELVASTVAAGVGLDAALQGAAGAVGGELQAELELAYANIALGRRRADELRDLAARTGSPSLAQLALTLRLSDRLGVPLAESLRRQADRARAQRARDVQERAAKAGPRVLVVVVFVLVPAALLPLAAAVLLTVSGAFSGF
jgi:pilus assembly protein TadC